MNVLTWTVLNEQETELCLTCDNLTDRQHVLREIDAQKCSKSSLSLLHSNKLLPSQVDILVDLYAHLIAFARRRQMSVEKTSTLVAIVHHLHECSMSNRLSRVASYNKLRELVIRHSVFNPPFAIALFTLDDVKHIDEYLLGTYYRFYKMYAYAFMPVQRATFHTHVIGEINDLPPKDLPPLRSALPEEVWKAKVQEQERAKEELRMETMEAESVEMEQQYKLQHGLNSAEEYPNGVREQLTAIRDAVTMKACDRLDLIEQKLSAIEAKVLPSLAHSRPNSRSISRKENKST